MMLDNLDLSVKPQILRGDITPPEVDLEGTGFLLSYLMEGIHLNTDETWMRYFLAKPYERADITLSTINPAEVSPTAKYVLKSGLERTLALDKYLLGFGFDIFNLRGVVKIDEFNYICPPILEIWNHPPYNGKPVIVDGAHRLYLALLRGIMVNCVVISGNISSMLPVLPLNGWHEVFERDTVPADKRNYNPNIPAPWKPHELYRTVIHGSMGPRILGAR